MKLYFDFDHKIVLAQHDGKTYHMATGKEVDYKCKRPLKPFDKPTYSRFIVMPDDEDKWEQALMPMCSEVNHKDGRICDFKIDGHLVTITRTINEVGEPFVTLTGAFPRYFWTGLNKLLKAMLNKDSKASIELEKEQLISIENYNDSEM